MTNEVVNTRPRGGLQNVDKWLIWPQNHLQLKRCKQVKSRLSVILTCKASYLGIGGYVALNLFVIATDISCSINSIADL